MIIVTPLFLKSSVFKLFSVENEKAALSNFSCLKTVFEIILFDGLVWTVG